MRRPLPLALLLLLLAGCGGLDRGASCREWLEASPEAQREFVAERARGRRVSLEEARALVTGTCRFAVRSGSHRVTADAAARSAVRTLAPAPEL